MHILFDSFYSFFFPLQCVKFSLHSHHPLTRNTFRSSPMPSTWISNTNKSHLFEFVWAPPCCERKVGGTGQRILELLSQNIDGTEPVPVTLQPKTHVNVLQVTSWQRGYFCLCREKVDWAWKACSFFSTAFIFLEFRTLQGGGGQPQLPTVGHRTAPTEPLGVKSLA